MTVTQLTVHLTDAELTLAQKQADRRSMSLEQLVAYAVRREISKAAPSTGPTRTQRRSHERAIALVRLQHYLDELPGALTQGDKEYLTSQLGITERTLYRYLKFLEEAELLDRRADEPLRLDA